MPKISHTPDTASRKKTIYLPDVAVQFHVLKKAALEVNQVILVHLNRKYVFDGKKIQLDRLFSRIDMTRKAITYQRQVPALLSGFNDMLTKAEAPDIRPGRHCKNPYECEFLEHCNKDMPEHRVLSLTGISQKKLMILRPWVLRT
jgi:predicted RecB family nuclease